MITRASATLPEHRAPDQRILDLTLESAEWIDSDDELSSLLVRVATDRTLNDRLRNLYLDIADGISSRYERDRALAALVRRGGNR